MPKTDAPVVDAVTAGNATPKTTDPTIDVEATQKAKLAQDVQETRDAQAAADEGVSGPEKKPGDPGFKTIEEDGELLSRVQNPHAESVRKPQMAWFKDSEGRPVLAPL